MSALYDECDLVLELRAAGEPYLDQSTEVTMSLAEAKRGLVVGCLDNATEDDRW